MGERQLTLKFIIQQYLLWLEFGVGTGVGAGAGEAVRRIMTAINTNEKTKITIKM